MTKLAAILDQIDSGSVLLPEFQRGYVWNRDQVRGLMRSLYRGYPGRELGIAALNVQRGGGLTPQPRTWRWTGPTGARTRQRPGAQPCKPGKLSGKARKE